MAQSPPTGKLARGAVGAFALAHAGAARIGHKARAMTLSGAARAEAQAEHEDELGRILFRALNHLKGTALKLSQLLSAHADFLPAGVRVQLARGNYQCTPLNRALVQKVLRQEFGADSARLFASFDGEAFAAASLGQVHRATLADGRPVAVKIQYPGIAASIGSDLRMLRALLQTLALRPDQMPRQDLVDQLMREVEAKLAEELDYAHEADQLAWFRERLDVPGIVIPEAVDSHSSTRVLTMGMLDGLHLDAWLATAPSQAQRDHAGQLLFDCFMHCVFRIGRVHADPHPGNFLFLPDGRVGVIDFGCTKALSPQFSEAIVQAWNARLRNDGSRARHAYVALGLIAPDLAQQEFDEQLMPILAPLLDWQVEPFRHGEYDFADRTPFPQPDPASSVVMNRVMQGVNEELVYFDRAWLGMQQILKQIGARVNTANAWIGKPP